MRRPLVLLVAAVVVMAGFALARAQVREPGPTYPLWEYRTEIIRGPTNQELSEGTLNSLGRDGWELAALTRREIRVQDLMQVETAYVFKRSRGEARR
jgi:hypothetical protein